MRWEQSLPPDLWLRKYRLKVRSHLAQITNEAAVGPGLELQVRSWTPSTCLMLPSTQDHHVAKEMQQLDGLSVFVLGPSVPVVRCLELARLKTFLGPRHLPQIIGTGSIQTSRCPGAYSDSCRSKLSTEQVDAWGTGLASQSLSLLRALSKQWTISASPLPEPIRAIDIGICLCMLSGSRVPGPVLQKGPSWPPKGLSTSGNEVSQQLSLPRNIKNRSK